MDCTITQKKTTITLRCKWRKSFFLLITLRNLLLIVTAVIRSGIPPMIGGATHNAPPFPEWEKEKSPGRTETPPGQTVHGFTLLMPPTSSDINPIYRV